MAKSARKQQQQEQPATPPAAKNFGDPPSCKNSLALSTGDCLYALRFVPESESVMKPASCMRDVLPFFLSPFMPTSIVPMSVDAFHGNALTHEGVHALVVALSRGALPSCERIDLHGAPGAHLVADALAARARGGSPSSVEAVVRRAKEEAQSAAVAREAELAKVGLPSQINST